MDFKKLGFHPVKMVKNLLMAVAAPYLFYHSVYKVEPGFSALKFDIFQGVKSEVYKEGYHVLIPFMQRPIIYDCRMKNPVFNCVASTKDLQAVQLKIRLICRPDVDRLPDLYRLLGMDYEDRVFFSIIFEICGQVLSQYNAAQLITQRDSISFLIKQKLVEKTKDFFIELDDVALVFYYYNKLFRLILLSVENFLKQLKRNKSHNRKLRE